jgi:hypothetical protein
MQSARDCNVFGLHASQEKATKTLHDMLKTHGQTIVRRRTSNRQDDQKKKTCAASDSFIIIIRLSPPSYNYTKSMVVAATNNCNCSGKL